jgi:serine protease Do
MVPALCLVVVISFIIGMMVSAGLKITPPIKAVGQEELEEKQPNTLNNNQLFVDLAAQLMPATVNISTTKVIKRRDDPYHNFDQDETFREFFGDEFFEKFFGGPFPPGRQDRTLRSLGSGFIVSEEGYIITNNHVIEEADEIKVRLSDKEEFDATIIGRDAKTDIALIKIDPPKDLPFVKLGDSDELKVGEWVMAIGNPFGLSQTVTVGIVSAKWRKIGAGPYENFIQTDAAINQGNSGGPLFNMKGEVVGVNTAIFSTTGGNIGIGFATPINLAKSVVDQLKEKGRVVRGWLGVIVQTVTPELAETFGLEEKKGALVADIDEEGPSARAGIEKGDIILTFDGKEISQMDELPLMVAQTPVGKKVQLEIMRDGKKITKEVTLGELKDEVAAAPVEEKNGGDIGMEVSDLTSEITQQCRLSEEEGVVVTYVNPDSPAGRAGLRRCDVIIEINRESVTNVDEYDTVLREARTSQRILVLLKRGRSTQFVVVTLGEKK